MDIKQAWEMYQTDLKMKVISEARKTSSVKKEDQKDCVDEICMSLDFDELIFDEKDLKETVLAVSAEARELKERIIEATEDTIANFVTLVIEPNGNLEKELLWCNNELKAAILPRECADMSFL